MKEKPHIVIVDDDPAIRMTIQEYLELREYRASAADGGQALRRIVGEEEVDLVLLDISMPGEDGLSLARFLREATGVGIIMLTGAGEIVDRVVGLEVGADDYLAKPVDLRELLARVKAVLRRLDMDRDAGAAESRRRRLVRFGTAQLDMDTHKLFSAEGQEIPLTSMEFDLLKAFAENPNRVLSRDQLLDLAHNRGWEPFDRSIDIRIARVRRKIEADPAKPQVIKTVRGAGYIYLPSRNAGQPAAGHVSEGSETLLPTS
ncbi:MAG: response regulator [Alphaproteobacteria bacterium]|nr:response regulator [Alphaproteobacteria bacterium]